MADEAGDASQRAEIGGVPRHWDVAPLSAFVTRVTYGFTNPMPTTDDGPFMVTAKDVHSGRIDFSTARHTSWDAYRNKLTDKSRPRINDVLLTKDGSIGRVAICDRADVCINQSVALLQPSSNMDPRFLKYLLESPYYQHRMEGDSDGTTIKHIYITRVDKMTVAVPPLPEQRAIARILSALDEKIELNRQMNGTLEVIAQALFKSWFVDFDPVRAKAEGHDPDPDLPKSVTDLFPDCFDDSELGEIPAGWTVRCLDEIAKFLNGLALQRFPAADGCWLPAIKIPQLRRGDALGADRVSADLPDDYIVKDGDVLFSWSGSLECQFWTGGNGALNQHLFKVTSENYPKWLFYYWTLHHLSDFRQIAAGKATTMGHIQRHHLTNAKVVLPSSQVLAVADRIFSPMIDQIIQRRIEAHTLTEVRDLLLPKLIFGEVRVKDAERVIRESA
jgi:type I restriction enzyme S subunit